MSKVLLPIARVDMLDMSNSKIDALFKAEQFWDGWVFKDGNVTSTYWPHLSHQILLHMERFSLLPNFHKHLNDLIY